MANTFTVTEQTPELSLLGGAAFSLSEPAPSFAVVGDATGVLSMTEPAPVAAFEGKTGVFAVSEVQPTVALTAYGPVGAELDTTEPQPVLAFVGFAATALAVTERRPTVALTGVRAVALASTEQLPTVTFTGIEGEIGNHSFAVAEQLPTLSFVSLVSASATSTTVELTEGPRPLEDYDAWSVNVANRAHSGFTNYRFNSFFTFNGVDYGVSDAGVFSLTGELDGVDPIPVKAIWGVSNLGNHFPKRFYRAFLTVRDRGGYFTVAAVMDEEERQTFTVDPTSKSGVHREVVRLRRDMIGTDVAVEVMNENGGDLEIHDLEVDHQVLKRRA